MKIRVVFYFLILLAGSFVHCKADTLKLSKEPFYTSINNYYKCFIDSNDRYSLQDVINKQELFTLGIFSEDYWRKYDHNKHFYYWLRVTLINPDTVNYATYVYEVFTFAHPKIWLYHPTASGTYVVDSMGYQFPFNTRPIKHKNPSFLTVIPPGKSINIYIKLYEKGGAYPYHIIRPYEKYMAYSLNEYLEKGIFLGFFLLVIMLNVFFFLALKEFSYLYYMFFGIFETLFVIFDGFGFQYVWPDYPVFNNYQASIAQCGLMISLILLCGYFLELKKKLIWAYRLYIVLAVARFAMLILQFVLTPEPRVPDSYIKVDCSIILLLILINAYIFYKEKSRFSFYFLLANVFFLIGFYQMVTPDDLPEFFKAFVNWLTGTWAMGFFFYMFAALHIMFVYIALADKIKHLKSDNETNQLKLIQQLEENKRIQENINMELEVKVRERTEEIYQQKEEILAQNEEMEKKTEQINTLYEELTDSIETARIIQYAILPPAAKIKTYLPDIFIFYQPKDIVSGDFYWFHHQDGLSYLAAVDCTGHGVAGAFMSVVGYNLLNQIMERSPGLSASKILDHLSANLVSSLNQNQENSSSREGMDISLCIIDHSAKKLEFAGANNPLYLVRNGELLQYKGDKFGIGLQKGTKNTNFSSVIIDIEKDDLFYIFSDGYAGQFGGPTGESKFMYNQFRQLILNCSSSPIAAQQDAVADAFYAWKKNKEQTDDVIVIGFRV